VAQGGRTCFILMRHTPDTRHNIIPPTDHRMTQHVSWCVTDVIWPLLTTTSIFFCGLARSEARQSSSAYVHPLLDIWPLTLYLQASPFRDNQTDLQLPNSVRNTTQSQISFCIRSVTELSHLASWPHNSDGQGTNADYFSDAALSWNPPPPLEFLGAFAKLQKATISFVLSVRVCVCAYVLPFTWNNSAHIGWIFMKFDMRSSRKSVEKFRFH
jgi:hypothetical protein